MAEKNIYETFPGDSHWKRSASQLLLIHCVKSVRIRSFFWSVFSCIQSEYRKIRTRKNSVFGHFSRSDYHYCQLFLPSNDLRLFYILIKIFFVYFWCCFRHRSIPIDTFVITKLISEIVKLLLMHYFEHEILCSENLWCSSKLLYTLHKKRSLP